VELAETAVLFRAPLHPYTEALLSAVPKPEPPKGTATRDRIILRGDVPSPVKPPSGCRFHTRCPYATNRCMVEEPLFRQVRTNQWVACHLRE
jgi:oligopeptide/dipeptide ABC transporter ATP-binding protein